MTYSIIGTGNIACFLGARLRASGHQCIGIYGRKKEVAELLADTCYAEKYSTIDDVYDGDADVCFLAVADVAIPIVADQLSFKKTVLIHTAGAVGIESLKDAARDYGVLWPIYSILKNNQPMHREIPCAWETNSPKAAKYLKEIAHGITDILFEAKYEQRKWLHVAAVVSNNFTTHLIAICDKICAENNLPFSVLMPIIEQTFDRIKHGDPKTMQTGPAIRKDNSTINAQMNLLEGHSDWQKIYESITHSIQNFR